MLLLNPAVHSRDPSEPMQRPIKPLAFICYTIIILVVKWHREGCFSEAMPFIGTELAGVAWSIPEFLETVALVFTFIEGALVGVDFGFTLVNPEFVDYAFLKICRDWLEGLAHIIESDLIEMTNFKCVFKPWITEPFVVLRLFKIYRVRLHLVLVIARYESNTKPIDCIHIESAVEFQSFLKNCASLPVNIAISFPIFPQVNYLTFIVLEPYPFIAILITLNIVWNICGQRISF